MQGFLSEDLPRGFYAKIFAQGPVQDNARQHSTKISTKSSHRGLYKIMPGTSDTISAGSLQDLLRRTCTRKDFTQISTRSSRKELHKILQGVFGEDSTWISTRSSHKELCRIMQDSSISTRSSHKDLYKIMQEPLMKDFIRIPQEVLTRICARSCQDLCKIMPGPFHGLHQDLHRCSHKGNRLVRACACAVDMHLGTSEQQFCAKISR